MSEYQYYEFQAIDRSLTEKEMAELRSYSTRARITPTSFVNHYEWGNFKGDEDAWMFRYFDAFLYLTNWGTHVFKVRLSSKFLDLADVRPYCSRNSLTARKNKDQVVLTFTSQDDEEEDWDTGEGILPSLIAIRAELARDDRRALYLGWLLAVQADEFDDEEPEPPVPPGMGQFSASLEALVEFLRIDPDLLRAAAETSPQMSTPSPGRNELMAWLATLPLAAKDTWLARLFAEDTLSVSAELHRRFVQDHDPAKASLAAPQRRTIGEIRRIAERHAVERRQNAEREAVADADRRQRQAARERAKRLDALVGKEKQLWLDVETLVTAKQSKNYVAAVEVLVDLRDLAARSGAGDFDTLLQSFRSRHARKATLMDRISKAGL
ncbi:hypothetical protein [Polyangium spumosum]|uniref:Uncharacterized protein n=1 Tax=Polyangium spumosum TaxID=889282 RepID=A0A6N7Q6C8_9BACT|nr:hypothetical protein [Polyangium spumosum]MRG98245.1 hypothetical protein [Polyangium spumosum]